MSRDISGLYTLPAGNPVTTGTTITTAWANTTLTDIADTLSDSLSRSGKGAMTAALKGIDGTVGAPGFTFASETTLGLYRSGAGVIGSSGRLVLPVGALATPALGFAGLTTSLWADATSLSIGINSLLRYRFSTTSLDIAADPGVGVAGIKITGLSGNFLMESSAGGPFIGMNVQGGVGFLGSSPPLVFGAGAATPERMRLDTLGSLLVGTTSSTNAARIVANSLAFSPGAADGWKKGALQGTGAFGGAFSLVNSGGASDGFCMYLSGNPSSLTIQFGANAGVVSAGVTLASTATAWAAASDERLKDIIEPISGALGKLASLRTVIGKYKKDAPTMRRAFLIAQDVQAVLPEAVDVGDEAGHLSLRYTELIPLIIAAINELNPQP